MYMYNNKLKRGQRQQYGNVLYPLVAFDGMEDGGKDRDETKMEAKLETRRR